MRHEQTGILTSALHIRIRPEKIEFRTLSAGARRYGLTTGSTGGFAGGKSPPGVLGNFELAA